VLPGGLGLQDDSEDYFKVERDGIQSILLVKSSEMRTKQGGAAILRAWRAERDVLYPGTEGDAGSQTSSLGRQSQEEISHLSNTTVTQLAITIYGDAEALARRGIDPVITSYHLPVHIADGVVPLKRFLDDFYPDGGTIFVGQSKYEWPPHLEQQLVLHKVRAHLYRKSQTHPHFGFWRDVVKGRSNLDRFLKHIPKLRHVESNYQKRTQPRVVDITNRNEGRRKRTGYIVTFGPPLEGAESGRYRID
jgi:hypothetical protein